MNTDKIKEAFTKAKEDIRLLNLQLNTLHLEVQELKKTVLKLLDRQTDTSTDIPAQKPENKAYYTTPADTSTDNTNLKALKNRNLTISTGNEGVPADRQTDRQTDTSTRNKGVKVRLTQEKIPIINSSTPESLTKVSEIVSSIDEIKKELKQKFKRVTKQEMAVFATIYQLEEEGSLVDYALIAKKLNLTESSIRDYIQRIIKKGLPLIKTKENNKKVFVSVSPDLKKMVSLSSLLEIREYSI